MNRTAIIWGVIVLVILLIFLWATVFIERPEKAIEVTPAAEEMIAEPVALESEKVKEKYYSIDLEYPKNSPTERAEIGNYIDKVRSDFMELVPKTDEEAEYQGVDADRAYVLKTTTTTYTSLNTITYKLETYMFTGGAHGNTFVATFTYGPDGKIITLANILSSPDSLTKLSSSARQYFYDKLGNQIERKEIDVGTEAKEENFSAWYVTNELVTFIFQQYQIGPYALGVQEFPMSRNEASTLLKI